jgi:peptidoglycan-associated lipoprotein
MKARYPHTSGMILLVSSALFLGACGHKKVAVTKPVPPPPPQPTATLTATPNSAQRGQSVQLAWSTQNATDVSIEGLGNVAANGNRGVSPSESTTYTLTAKGPGGTVQATARVTMNVPPPPPVKTVGPTDLELFNSHVKDIFFAYDKAEIRPEEQESLKSDLEFLQAHPSFKILVSGHCDERGSEDYNLALGTNRANTVRDQLAKFGISRDRIRTVSYGKEKPFCSDENEQCWQQNRRAHFTLDR